MSRPSPILFTSLGMVVLDNIKFPDKEHHDVIRGSGTYAILGARIFSPYPSSNRIGWALRVGNDLPRTCRTLIDGWRCQLEYVHESEGVQATRGHLVYTDVGGDKSFAYTSPVLQVVPAHLSFATLSATAFHTLASPGELSEQVSSLIALRNRTGIQPARPELVVWEPRPNSCVPDQMHAFLEVLKLVDMVSPNHNEFKRLFGEQGVPAEEGDDINKEAIEIYAERIVSVGINEQGTGTLVIRAGKVGCLVVSRKLKMKWLPAFYAKQFEGTTNGHRSSADLDSNDRVYNGDKQVKGPIDPTGAGNAFLGGFTVGLLESGDVVKAAGYGNVASSFALEQVGLPDLSQTINGEELLKWKGSKRKAERISEEG